jgi:hypothetical protein
MKVDIPSRNLAAVLASLGLGTLEAIRAGALPPGAATWTLAPPRMWEPLGGVSGDVDEVLDVFQSCDELAAIQELLPDQFEAKLDALIVRLRKILGSQPESVWEVTWQREEEKK